MTNDLAYAETFIQQRLPENAVFQSNDHAQAELDIQNLPGRSPQLVRVLLSHKNAAAMRRDPAFAEQVIATIRQALETPSGEQDGILDLQGQFNAE